MTDTGHHPVVKIVKKEPRILLPRYETPEAAGMDLRACLEEALVLPPLGRQRIPTGLILEIPKGYEGQVRPRSGLAAKHGVTVLNAPGTIDADYRGEVAIILINLGSEAFTVNDGDRIAQLVITPVCTAVLEEQTNAPSSLSDTARGAGGFGSTGL